MNWLVTIFHILMNLVRYVTMFMIPVIVFVMLPYFYVSNVRPVFYEEESRRTQMMFDDLLADPVPTITSEDRDEDGGTDGSKNGETGLTPQSEQNLEGGPGEQDALLPEGLGSGILSELNGFDESYAEIIAEHEALKTASKEGRLEEYMAEKRAKERKEFLIGIPFEILKILVAVFIGVGQCVLCAAGAFLIPRKATKGRKWRLLAALGSGMILPILFMSAINVNGSVFYGALSYAPTGFLILVIAVYFLRWREARFPIQAAAT